MEDCLAPLLSRPSRAPRGCILQAEREGMKAAQLQGRSPQPHTGAGSDSRPVSSSYTLLWAHSGERQLWQGQDCLQESIFPIPSCTGHTLSPVMVRLEESFPCAHRSLCFNKPAAFFLHLLLKGARKPVQQAGIFSSAIPAWRCPEPDRIWCLGHGQSSHRG